MINVDRSFDIKNGVVIKGNGANRVGIYYGDQTPDLEDAGNVQQGSLYIRTDGSIWQKTGTANTSWVLNSAVSGGGAVSSNAYLFSREDAAAVCWLKIDSEISSDEIGHIVSAGTSLNVSLALKDAQVVTIELYKRSTAAPTYALIGSLSTLVTERVKTITIPTVIDQNDEIAAKMTVGDNDVVMRMEVV